MVKKKCKFCGEELILPRIYTPEIVFYQNAWWHTKCLQYMYVGKKINYEKCYANSEVKASAENAKADLQFIIHNHYNVSIIPKGVLKRLDNIYVGNDKSEAKVSAEDLLEMFQIKQPYLDKLSHKTRLVGVSRFLYDLAILTSKYNSFKEWKIKQAAEQKQVHESLEKCEFTPTVKTEKCGAGLEDVLDDMFE